MNKYALSIAVLAGLSFPAAAQFGSGSSVQPEPDVRVGPTDTGTKTEGATSSVTPSAKETESSVKQVTVPAKTLETSDTSDRMIGVRSDALDEGASLEERMAQKWGATDPNLPNEREVNNLRLDLAEAFFLLEEEGVDPDLQVVLSNYVEGFRGGYSDLEGWTAQYLLLLTDRAFDAADVDTSDPDLAPEITEFEGFGDYAGSVGSGTDTGGAETGDTDSKPAPPLVEAGDDSEFAGKTLDELSDEYSTCTMRAMNAQAQMGVLQTSYGDDPSTWTEEQNANFATYAEQAAEAENRCRRIEARIEELLGGQ